MWGTSPRSEQSEIATCKRRIWNIILFLWSLYLLLYILTIDLLFEAATLHANQYCLWIVSRHIVTGIRKVDLFIAQEAISIRTSVYLVDCCIGRITTCASLSLRQSKVPICRQKRFNRCYRFGKWDIVNFCRYFTALPRPWSWDTGSHGWKHRCPPSTIRASMSRIHQQSIASYSERKSQPVTTDQGIAQDGSRTGKKATGALDAIWGIKDDRHSKSS